MADNFTEKQLDNFRKAASSLKLYSRAELSDDKDRSLIEKLYVDPLPNEQAFKTMLVNNTTILIGRKGTGKSTVFQRTQHEIRKHKSNIISTYMDIRNVYEASQVDSINTDKLDGLHEAMEAEHVKKLLLYNRFIRMLIGDIRDELKAQVEQSFLSKLRERVSGTAAEVFAGLDRIIANLDKPKYENVAAALRVEVKAVKSHKDNIKNEVSAELSASVEKIGGSAKLGLERDLTDDASSEKNYAEVLMRIVGINDIVKELKQILESIGIKYLYIFLDDFSELPQDAMTLLVDSLISPLTRWSEFIKFKIAAYPGRVYLGSLDKTKVEEFHLDTYDLYGSNGVNKMEDKATDFVKRVVQRRISHYCRCDADEYFASSDVMWKTLFNATMANPRILGHIMIYAYESHLLYESKIGIQAIQEASQRYYEEKISPFFESAKYRNSFHERSSIYSLKELLEKIVGKSRGLRQEDRSRPTTGSRSRSFSSHFYVSNDFDRLLTSLELNFFVTKYFEMSDRGGTRVSVYALNHGLCSKYQIGFGRPIDRREDRLFFVDRSFDYNSLMRSYIVENQEIRCDNCERLYDEPMLPALKLMHMMCPACQKGVCHVVNLSRKYEDLLKEVNVGLLLPETELGILYTLHYENRIMVASEIAAELDCSGQLVGRRGRNLAERVLVTREQFGGVYKYEITREAELAYFQDPASPDLDVD
ncbi:hypothetical protein AFCDBAGC_1678 [Methylobacterium cerastii]|uniref:Orc1-like AAA ATPase domain-containing protein n=1 Tax=Methylobacterium cerastii TaxID=932741 RepID=A0ABQ4QG19_9HYPH|nr:EutP/PduV family microcompartment system protein [Methylobacterium cerastii]GJD43820.1 hypothetical protein AFCDBAGC_1678 [Methylobacterium cerastii]